MSATARVARPADARQVAVDPVIDGDQRRALRRDLKFVQVGLVAVARAHDRQLPVGAVDDHLPRLAQAAGDQRVLPPGEHGLSFVLLHAEVRRARAGGRQRLEPDQRAVFAEDHRPVLARPGIRRDEDVAGRRAGGVRGDGDGRRLQVRARVKALVGGLLRRRTRAAAGDAAVILHRRREAPGERNRRARRARSSARGRCTVSPCVNGLDGRKLAPLPCE